MSNTAVKIPPAVLNSPSGLVDTMFLYVAKRIQLSPTEYRTATAHYEALDRYLRRTESPLNGKVARLYAQGSVAIGSVISSKFDKDEFDIDVIAELNLPLTTPPADALNTLFKALNAEHGSQYYGKVKRRTRCVTVQYANMHVDVTPAILIPNATERTSYIFHAHENEPVAKHRCITANPWGFIQWFEKQMPESLYFTDTVIGKRTEPLPDQEALNEKSTRLVALQLIKRWRNKVYDGRPGRMPPSIMLSCLVAKNMGHQKGIFQELQAQASYLLRTFEGYQAANTLVRVVNPTCPDDIFTDRWPANATEQKQFIHDLKQLNAALIELGNSVSPDKCLKTMTALFGERPAVGAMADLTKRYSQKAHVGELQHSPGTGAVALGGSGIGVGGGVTTFSTAKHSNFGSE